VWAARRALARQALRDGRTRTLCFAALFGLVALVQPLAYRHSYPTVQDRIGFARAFGDNTAVRLFYGVPHDLLTVGGYSGWRVGGFMSIFAGVWGLLAAVRALRAEEEAGRQELVLAGIVSRREAFAAALVAIAAGAALLWIALFAGLLAGGLPAGGSAYLALAAVSPVPVFVGVGAVASQLASTRRLALELVSAALLLALVARVVADTSQRLDWLRWATPLGWVEELRPFAGARPAVLVLPLVASGLLLVVALALNAARDVGTGLLSARDSAAPRARLLGSSTAQALRDERGSLIAWLVGVGFFAAIVGLLSDTFSGGGISHNLQRQFSKVGGASLTTPSGALGFYFLFFVVVISLFGCAQVAAIRREEADQRLETLFALPVSRRGWLAGRTAIAAGGAVLLALGAGVLAWAGATAAGAGVSLPDMLGAGANCLPAALLFLGLGLLAFGGAPRASAGIAYGLVAAAFVWELFGAVLGAPSWTLDLSPFHHVGLVPAQPFKATAAAVMLAVGAVATFAALGLFERRDLTGT
jgi:ABC-2 type transport system permease protein